MRNDNSVSELIKLQIGLETQCSQIPQTTGLSSVYRKRMEGARKSLKKVKTNSICGFSL